MVIKLSDVLWKQRINCLVFVSSRRFENKYYHINDVKTKKKRNIERWKSTQLLYF